ncbi:SDR family oxidoreductase (plasmid) [Streptomyces sp. NBC_01387]|uniref:SDR family oxidoreductase n=1 Tax=unclassified Streptomyces TaxID=2593676 RepID=UPI00225429AE|nr:MULTISPECIES: SDR family oxidoreductase [unclassified Streptomyces]MCX4554509.1 SDR family oxidoreductase [Streptomyces sp. NBC_01500]WSC25108.1 SDR family oxidoreductase [Streptomyces sp. NBC_01766]WSV59011.1 SDR family oxidoreductase [Streptomyces sp. NBC_01014]
MQSLIAVIGGAGRTGVIITRRLLQEGHQVRVISRDPQRAVLPSGVEKHRADVRYTDALVPALRGCSGIVFTVEPGTADSGPSSPETTVYDGVRNVLAAATDGGQRPRMVLVSQIFVTRREHPMNAYGRLLDWRLRGEDEVRASGLPYTVVRPSWLTDSDVAGSRVRLEQHDRGDGWVSRKSVAEACVQSLRLPAAGGTTFELYNEPGAEPTDWSPLFAQLIPDRVPAYLGPVH